MQQIRANERLWLKRIYIYIYTTSDRGPESKSWIFFSPLLLLQKKGGGDKFTLKVEQLTNWCLLLFFEQTPFSDVHRMTAHGSKRCECSDLSTLSTTTSPQAKLSAEGGGGVCVCWGGAFFLPRCCSAQLRYPLHPPPHLQCEPRTEKLRGRIVSVLRYSVDPYWIVSIDRGCYRGWVTL